MFYISINLKVSVASHYFVKKPTNIQNTQDEIGMAKVLVCIT